MPRLSSRAVSLFYREPLISTAELKAIYEWYRLEVPMDVMLRKLQAFQDRRGTRAAEFTFLTYADLYAVIFDGITANRLKQRLRPKDELTVADFQRFFAAWKEGGTFDQCWKETTMTCSQKFANRVFRTMGDRYRQEQEMIHGRRKTSAGRMILNNEEKEVLTRLLTFSERTVVREKAALVIYISDIPFTFIKELMTSGSHGVRTLAMLLDPTILSGQEILKQAAEQSSNPEIQADPDSIFEDQDTTDINDAKAVRAELDRELDREAESLAEELPDTVQPPLPPSITEPLQLLSASRPGTPGAIPAPKLDLENLMDEDGLEDDGAMNGDTGEEVQSLEQLIQPPEESTDLSSGNSP